MANKSSILTLGIIAGVTLVCAGTVLGATKVEPESVLQTASLLPATSASASPPYLTPRRVQVEKGVFLVARSQVKNSYFSHSVVLVVDHGSEGTLGVIINRRSPVSLARFLPELQNMVSNHDQVYLGGPVSQHVIVLLVHTPEKPQPAVAVKDNMYFTSSIDVLKRMLKSKNPGESVRAYVGYAGWSVGQLQTEIDRGDWYVVQADAETVFKKNPKRIWRELIQLLDKLWVQAPGVDISLRLSAR